MPDSALKRSLAELKTLNPINMSDCHILDFTWSIPYGGGRLACLAAIVCNKGQAQALVVFTFQLMVLALVL